MVKTETLIIGGGPAGLAVAAELCQKGRSVIVIERSDYASYRVGEHLTPKGAHWLYRLGAGFILDEIQHLPCPGVCFTWGSRRISDNLYIYNPYGEGWNLSRPHFDREFAVWVKNLGVQVLTQSWVDQIRQNGGNWEVEVGQHKTKKPIRASFLIDATGRAATIARHLGSQRRTLDRLIGITGIGEGSTNHSEFGNMVFIEAVDSGWWYSVPLHDNRILFTFMTDADIVRRQSTPWPTYWHEQLSLSQFTKQRLKFGYQVGQVWVRSAHSQTLTLKQGNGWIAVGDAAVAFDPLSSKGMSKSLEWARPAADTIDRYLGSGGSATLQQYDQMVQLAFDQYLVQRKEYYSQEQRWQKLPFWARRQNNMLQSAN